MDRPKLSTFFRPYRECYVWWPPSHPRCGTYHWFLSKLMHIEHLHTLKSRTWSPTPPSPSVLYERPWQSWKLWIAPKDCKIMTYIFLSFLPLILVGLWYWLWSWWTSWYRRNRFCLHPNPLGVHSTRSHQARRCQLRRETHPRALRRRRSVLLGRGRGRETRPWKQNAMWSAPSYWKPPWEGGCKHCLRWCSQCLHDIQRGALHLGERSLWTAWPWRQRGPAKT